jgi:SAM-dependent methyltransferase/uncharacterized protein YbaR (Trm112 family)
MTSEPTFKFPVKLVCPRCRKPGADGQLVVSFLIPAGDAGSPAALECPRCRTSYDWIDGIPCVPYDPESFRRSQAHALSYPWFCEDMRRALSACRLAGQLDPACEAFHEVANTAFHTLAHFPNGAETWGSELECNGSLIEVLVGWLKSHEFPRDTGTPSVLEVGCGPGALMRALAPLFPDGALGLDWRIGVLRVARRISAGGEIFLPFCVEGRRFEPVRILAPLAPGAVRFVQGDILTPPLEAEVFPAVVALSFLDAVADPLFALGQLDALLAPSGLLLIGTPYSWDARVTAPADWWSDMDHTGRETLRAALSGRHPVLPHLKYEILQELAHVPWAIPGHGRLVFRFSLDLVLARKTGGAFSKSC